MRVEIDSWNNKFYFNDKNQLHNEDGPAAILSNGEFKWYFISGVKLSKEEFEKYNLSKDPLYNKIIEINGRNYTLTPTTTGTPFHKIVWTS